MTFWHRHKWRVTGVELLERGGYIGPSAIVRCPVTEVLKVCECGRFETVTLDGHWTLDQLRPAQHEAEADNEFFRRLGVKHEASRRKLD